MVKRMAEYIDREVPWDDQYISKTDAIKLAAITVVPFATSENIQDIHKAFERTIDKYPAADVAPVVHGKWVYDEVCSVCRVSKFHYFYFTETGDWDGVWNYCPNCGAKMTDKVEQTPYNPPFNWCGEEPIGDE